MSPLSKSYKLFLSLLLLFALLTGVNVFLPQGGFALPAELPFSKSVFAVLIACLVFVVYGGLGVVGMKLSKNLGFAELLDTGVTNRQRLIIPAIIGVCIGLFFILADMVFSKFHSLGPLPHPPFPTSLVASATAGIGEEVLFRLFFIPFWVWLISHVILRDRWKSRIFWIVTIFSALAFAVAHIPSFMFLLSLRTISDIPPAVMTELILLNGVVSVFAAYFFRKYGFLAAVGIHFWTDIVWHVLWGLR